MVVEQFVLIKILFVITRWQPLFLRGAVSVVIRYEWSSRLHWSQQAGRLHSQVGFVTHRLALSLSLSDGTKTTSSRHWHKPGSEVTLFWCAMRSTGVCMMLSVQACTASVYSNHDKL